MVQSGTRNMVGFFEPHNLSVLSTNDWEKVATLKTCLSVIYDLKFHNEFLVASGIDGVIVIKWLSNGELQMETKLTSSQANQRLAEVSKF